MPAAWRSVEPSLGSMSCRRAGYSEMTAAKEDEDEDAYEINKKINIIMMIIIIIW